MARDPNTLIADALIKREFSSYDVATLPSDIPAFMVCSAWKNDICPSWRDAEDAGALELWIDFPNAEDREFPGSPRFLVQRRTADNSEEFAILYHGDDWPAALLALKQNALAVEFSKQVRESFSEAEMAQIIERNRATGPDTCATHDFADANEIMDSAWETLFGRSFAPDEGEPPEADFAIWNAAWSVAKAAEFKLGA